MGVADDGLDSGDDDYFSSDLPDNKVVEIWGRLEQPVLILPSEKDEWVPPEVDVMGLVNKWKSFCKPGIASDLSGLIPGANHTVGNHDGQQWLADRVARFLVEVEKFK
jgi:pimeloyl-ACP methyl ester carboxylesterase